MKLIIDIGNTRTKIAVFSGQTMVCVKAFDKFLISDISEVINQFEAINRVIYSAVGINDIDREVLQTFLNRFDVLEMSRELNIPILNNYSTPQTLGQDRIAALVGTHGLFAYENCLVIDAGSCITIDFIDKNVNYSGGSISPGIRMKYKALNNFTAKLPLIDQIKEVSIIGNNTLNSIMSGVINGTLMEIKGFIDYYKSKYLEVKTILTGGDSDFIFNQIGRNNMLVEEHLVLYGLNIILDSNAKK